MSESPAHPQDYIARYIYSRNDYSSNGVKPSAFMPPGAHPNELSVCVISDLQDDIIWKIGRETRKDKQLLARGDLIVSQVQEIPDEQGNHLNVLIDGIPHERHANIKSLPTDKSLQKAIAIQLAKKALLKPL